jgi:hypothetical protein
MARRSGEARRSGGRRRLGGGMVRLGGHGREVLVRRGLAW